MIEPSRALENELRRSSLQITCNTSMHFRSMAHVIGLRPCVCEFANRFTQIRMSTIIIYYIISVRYIRPARKHPENSAQNAMQGVAWGIDTSTNGWVANQDPKPWLVTAILKHPERLTMLNFH